MYYIRITARLKSNIIPPLKTALEVSRRKSTFVYLYYYTALSAFDNANNHHNAFWRLSVCLELTHLAHVGQKDDGERMEVFLVEKKSKSNQQYPVAARHPVCFDAVWSNTFLRRISLCKTLSNWHKYWSLLSSSPSNCDRMLAPKRFKDLSRFRSPGFRPWWQHQYLFDPRRTSGLWCGEQPS